MEPQHLIRTFRRRWRPIVFLVVLVGALGAASASVAEDVAPAAVPVVRYDACHTLLVDGAIPQGVPKWDVENLPQLAERVTAGEIPRNVATLTGVDESTAANQVRVGVRNDIRSLVICSVGKTPAEAEQIADAYAAELIAVLEQDAQEFFDESLERAHELVINAEACFANVREGNDFTEGSDIVSEIDVGDQSNSVCESQLIQAHAKELNLTSTGVPVVPFETLEVATAVEISERDFATRVREGAVGANVIVGNNEAVGAAAPTSTGAPGGSTIPSSPLMRGLIGIIVGLGMGTGYVQFTERLDSRLRRKEDVETTLDLPVLAEIPPLGRKDRKDTRMVVVDEPRSRSAESFRALRSALDYAQAVDVEHGRASEGAQVILVTSGAPSEGKTTTLANLAAVMAESDRRVLAINCDFRRPRLHRYLGGATEPQRLNVTDIAGVQMVTQVTASDAESTPSDVVAAQRRLVERARNRFDAILLDTAPILTTNDAAELLSVVDHVVLVVSAGNTKAEAAARASELLERRGCAPLGVALVGTRDVPNSSDYYYSDDDPYLVSSKRPRRNSKDRGSRESTGEPPNAAPRVEVPVQG